MSNSGSIDEKKFEGHEHANKLKFTRTKTSFFILSVHGSLHYQTYHLDFFFFFLRTFD